MPYEGEQVELCSAGDGADHRLVAGPMLATLYVEQIGDYKADVP
jgi:hypothetical protein